MRQENGIILIITLFFLSLLSLLSLSALDACIEAKRLVNIQQQRNQLFEAAESELMLAERKVMLLNLNETNTTKIITDDQFIKDKIPSSIVQHCMDINAQQKNCYYIELLTQEKCVTAISQQPINAIFFRITAIVIHHSLIDMSAILQSTYLLLPPAIQNCHSEQSPSDAVQYFYAGRQSWRELV